MWGVKRPIVLLSIESNGEGISRDCQATLYDSLDTAWFSGFYLLFRHLVNPQNTIAVAIMTPMAVI
jgi:hypothetical protein